MMSARLILILLLAALVSPSLAWSDDLTGKVLDPQGKVVSDAQLRLFDRKSGELRKTTSSQEGSFSFQGIPAGQYLLEADASDAALTGSRVVNVSGTQNVELQLRISGTNTEVLVTASGTPLTIEEVAKALDVVDSKTIDQRDELSITEAIRNIPGLRIKTLAGPGSFTSINTRGLRAQDTAVLVDGMRFRDAASPQGDATGFLEDLTTVDTERVEILRGSGSSLYGSSALAGVMNITSRPGGGATHGEFRTEGGGLGLIRSVIGIGGGLKADRFTYSGSVALLNMTKGVRDGNPYRNTGTQGSAKYNFTPRFSIGGRFWYDNNYLASTESPTYTTATLANGSGPIYNPVPLPIDELEKFEQKQPFTVGNATFIPNQIDPDGRRLGEFLSGAVNVQHQITPNTSYRVIYQRVNTKRTYIDGPAGPGLFEPTGDSRSSYDGYTDTIQARLDQNAGKYNLISGGYEFEHEKYFSFNGTNASSNSVDLRQRSHALFVQDQLRLVGGQLQLIVAGRAQSFSLKDPVFSGFSNPFTGASTVEPPTAYTGDGAVAYFFRSTGTKLRGHVGNSFRAPSGFERFGGGSGTYYGDPRLTPERAVAFDGGIDQYFMGSKLQLNGTYFYTNLQQTIVFENSLPPGDEFNRFLGYKNSAGGGVARGFELGGRVSPSSRTTIETSYTYTNSDSRTPTIASIGFHENLGISKHAFTLTATQWFARRFSVAYDMSVLSNYTTVLFGLDFTSAPFKFDGPTKADVVLHYDYPISEKRSIDFYGKVENVFNQRHYEDGFLGPKAWAIGGFKLKF
jgi:iron complex outermembrane receptor protein